MSYYGYSYTSDDEDDIDPDAPIAGPSRSQDWYVNPTPEVEGRAGQYEHEGYDLIDASGNQFVDPYAIHPGVYTGVEPDTNVDGVYIPSQVGCPPEGGLESTHLPYFPPPPYGASEQPLPTPSSVDAWSDSPPTTTAYKGKVRATDEEFVGNDGWWHKRPPITQNYGATPPPTVVPDAPSNTEPSAPIAPSHGPQRSRKDAKGKGRANPLGKGKRELPLPEATHSSWDKTWDRLVVELLEEYFFRRPGTSINPETACANINNFIREDLHRSPIAGQAATSTMSGKDFRVFEQYLMGILRVLRPPTKGRIQTDRELYTRVLREIESELHPTNGPSILRERPSLPHKPEELGASNEKVRRRESEQRRRTALRDIQEEIATFFLVPWRSRISVGELLLLVVIFLRIGRVAFPGLVFPRDGRWCW